MLWFTTPYWTSFFTPLWISVCVCFGPFAVVFLKREKGYQYIFAVSEMLHTNVEQHWEKLLSTHLS